jgi:predicted SAM-dependent methyltransferase
VAVKKLNIGCGDHPLDGWFNTDLNPCHPQIARLDATQPFVFPDGYFDYVFSEHMIEHVPYAGARVMLYECRRVLKPGGKIRISTPNLEFLLELLEPPLQDIETGYIAWACREFNPGMPATAVTVLNNFVRCWGHQFIYDPRTLVMLMAEAGFTGFRDRLITLSEDPELADLENDGRMPEGFLQLETMTIEAEVAQ